MKIRQFSLRQSLLRDPGGYSFAAQPTQGSQTPFRHS
jgi:hypothetical protein